MSQAVYVATDPVPMRGLMMMGKSSIPLSSATETSRSWP